MLILNLLFLNHERSTLGKTLVSKSLVSFGSNFKRKQSPEGVLQNGAWNSSLFIEKNCAPPFLFKQSSKMIGSSFVKKDSVTGNFFAEDAQATASVQSTLRFLFHLKFLFIVLILVFMLGSAFALQ